MDRFSEIQQFQDFWETFESFEIFGWMQRDGTKNNESEWRVSLYFREGLKLTRADDLSYAQYVRADVQDSISWAVDLFTLLTYHIVVQLMRKILIIYNL